MFRSPAILCAAPHGTSGTKAGPGGCHRGRRGLGGGTVDGYDPYCGNPAPMAVLLRDWNPDPLLALPLALFALWAIRARNGAALAGAGVLAALFLSPLCALAVSLFSVRVFNHMALIAVAAPLLALAFRPAIPAGAARLGWPAFAAHTALLWAWHAPGPYDLALAQPAVYAVMEGSLLLSAMAFWACLLATPRDDAQQALLLVFAMLTQMGFLGALFVLGPAVLHPWHAFAAPVAGWDALADQQLAGVLMWVPGAIPYLAFMVWRLRAAFHPPART